MSDAARLERAAALRALVSVAFAAYVGTLIAAGRVSTLTAVVTYVAVIAGSVALHEGAHAAVVKMVGGQLLGMRLGFGPRLSPASSRLDLRPLLIAGHVSYRPPRAVRRSQLFAIGVAGIVVHALLCLVALTAGHGAWPVWRIDLLVANVAALLSNAIPATGSFTTTAGGPNDGAQLSALLRQRGPLLVGSDPDYVEVRKRYETGGLTSAAGALAALERPDVPSLRLQLAGELLANGCYLDAAALAAEVGSDAYPPWAADHLYAESVALLLLTAPRVDYQDPRIPGLAAAAERAVAVVPVDHAGPVRAGVTHTLGMARLLQQRFAEAATIASWCLHGTATATDRAAVLATQGWALLSLGERAQAEHALRAALGLAPTEPLTRAFAGAFAATPA